MNPDASALLADPAEEIPALIETLLATERRLVELTGGEVDAVAGHDGRMFLLQRAQEQLRHSDTARQAALLNALPAHIALLDAQGGIMAVNDAWQRFGRSADRTNHRQPEGVNYLAVCDATQGPGSADARAAAAGIRTVLAGTARSFSLEYPFDSSAAPGWFLLLVTPLMDAHVHDAVVMHVDITGRKQAEAVTRESEERFRGIFTAAPTGIAITSPQGRFLHANPAYCQMLGYTEAELQERDFAAVTHPADLASAPDRRDEVGTAEPNAQVAERRYVKKGGATVWARGTLSAVHAATGEPADFIVVAEDITERKRLEARLRRLVDSDAQGVIFWNTRGEITDANDAFLRLSRYTREDLKAGRINWAAMTPPEYVSADQRALRELAATGVCVPYEKEWVRADGSRVPILLGAAMFEDDPEEGLCFVIDVTERGKAVEALRASETRFKVLFEQAAVGVTQIDATTGRFVQINQRFAAIVGRSREELEPLTSAAITHPADAASSRDLACRLRAGDIHEASAERRYVRPDGSEVWVNVTVSAMGPPDEAPDSFIEIVQDITGRKKLEEHLHQTQKMDAIGTLAGGVAHDFNNVLAAINGYTELSCMVLTDNPQVREHLGSILQASGRAAALVRQILTFSRGERTERRPLALPPVVEETLQLLRATIPSTITFDVVLAADVPAVLADATQIHQILMNLGTNAWHAMKDHPGRLQVKLESQVIRESDADAPGRLRPGRYAHLSVSDTGCGMEPATLQRIFEPFFTTKPVGQGTGLGLAVVHGIMAGHDGAVTVYSQPGEGTVFHLYFPAHAGQALEPVIQEEPEEPTPLGRGEQVLLIDDEAPLIQLGQTALTALGYGVEVTQDPTTALAWVRAEPARFDLVITDQTMPGMTGLALAGELKRLRPGLPVILMTGYGLTLTPERLAAAGIHQLLLKPTTIHALGTAVHAALVAR